LPARVFCDTSYFYACADSEDASHRDALTLANEGLRRRTQLWTTWDVVSETVTLLRYRHSWGAAIRFLDDVKPRLHLADYGPAVRVEAEELFRRHGRSRRLSFCDAISFVVVRKVLDDVACLTFDDDFRRLGLHVIAVSR
jgi:predicted nucleic acid-binding protein